MPQPFPSPLAHIRIRLRTASVLSTLAFSSLVAIALQGCTSNPVTPPLAPRMAPTVAPRPSDTALPDTPSQGSASALTAGEDEAQRFTNWLRHFRTTALAAGIAETTLREALDPARLQPRSIELDRSQPEFTRAIWDYLDRAVSPTRVSTGQARLNDIRPEAERTSARYGVPMPVLAAVWGMESNYGSHHGDVPVIDALATLAFEGRRAAWAQGELLAALRIVQQGDIDRTHMIGSWAGAMGQTQFMPSAFLARAVDADGDGRRDIWQSMPDVLASTAHFLQQAGWVPGEPCAPELRLPEGFDPARADPAIRQDSALWRAEGLRLADGRELPAMAEASVLQPAGLGGPAFLVGRNFRAVLRYNNATSYGLGVCLLAQQIDGGPPVQAAWPRDQRPLNRSEVKALQAALRDRGFPTGQPDGLFGPTTRAALREYQRSAGLPADGFATEALLNSLRP